MPLAALRLLPPAVPQMVDDLGTANESLSKPTSPR